MPSQPVRLYQDELGSKERTNLGTKLRKHTRQFSLIVSVDVQGNEKDEKDDDDSGAIKTTR